MSLFLRIQDDILLMSHSLDFVATKETTNPDHEFLSVQAILDLTCEIVVGQIFLQEIAYHAGVPYFRSAPQKTYRSS